ncbi:exonuclease domain-containing protein [Xanthocytophaga agilis]|uniref:Exonuclease domain-containing protein n=1 Tax=Xanthocytophaga agilis TaxID=3048010 RepID=A0AAE3R2R3_9BACT|nr:exonuclease domain-containing protein [Xanthocytophaga agilis]MDJ1499793.1 exonuclease domain-containing protein [Xanthocytophaga agilis]
MHHILYAIVDIETTGGQPDRDRITEIAIVLHNGKEIVERYETLVNPGRSIPYEITQLTGISNEMVRDAPPFYEVARKIVELTEGAVFVAHNVRFDYSFIKSAFKDLGYNYQRKTLCTVRMSRKSFPGLPSYSLGKLCQSLGVTIENRHRAMGDAEATAEVFGMIMNQHQITATTSADVEDWLSLEVKSQTLPPRITREQVLALPEDTGVYYFHDEHGKVMYVGKSINIRKRIIQHFQIDYKSRKSIEFKNNIASITYELTGSELVALLYESDEIKKIKPRFNTQQKRSRAVPFYGVYEEADKNGYINLYVERLSSDKEPLTMLDNWEDARNFLYNRVQKFGLCLQKCDLHKTGGPCFNYHIHQCKGACVGIEPIDEYNTRARAAIESFSFQNESFFIVGRGRHEDEKSVVCIEKGRYIGFGYLDTSVEEATHENLRASIRKYPHNQDIQRILCSYVRTNRYDKVIPYQSLSVKTLANDPDYSNM